jgi:ketosteroid isomerase-like protein
MGAKENLAVVDALQQAFTNRDWDAYGELLADDATFRMAGVPSALGGVTRGRDAVVAMMRNNSEGDGSFEERQRIADDNNVCIIGKVGAPRFRGNDFLRSAEKPFSSHECIIYRIEDGLVKETTAYLNWLDVYTQVGLVDPASLTP